MERKQVSIVPKSMQQDISVSLFPNDAAYEIRNMRIVTTGDSTTLSLVNEKSNKQITIQGDFEGDIIGTITVGYYVVIFTVGSSYDHIYRGQFLDDSTLKVTDLIRQNMDFSIDRPIEGIGIIEGTNVYKVYWVDGANQPRVLNILDPIFRETQTDYSVDFLSNIGYLVDSITVSKNQSGGNFTPGVIQYAFSYFNKYGGETPIINISTLNYIGTEQGIANDKKSNCSFTVTLWQLSTKFDYVRVYAIERSSINGPVSVRILKDIYIRGLQTASDGTTEYIDVEVSVTDTGTTGESISPNILFYLGGENYIANTITFKDNTLFLGNLKDNQLSLHEATKERIASKILSIGGNSDIWKLRNVVLDNDLYSYNNKGLLNFTADKITTFKYGETYRLGLQLQYSTGKFSEVIVLGDFKNTKMPNAYNNNNNIGVLQLPYIQIVFNDVVLAELHNLGAVRARLMMTPPTQQDYSVLCQGLIVPTLFNIYDRTSGTTHNMPDWIMRDYGSTPNAKGISTHYDPIPDYEVQSTFKLTDLSACVGNLAYSDINLIYTIIKNQSYTELTITIHVTSSTIQLSDYVYTIQGMGTSSGGWVEDLKSQLDKKLEQLNIPSYLSLSPGDIEDLTSSITKKATLSFPRYNVYRTTRTLPQDAFFKDLHLCNLYSPEVDMLQNQLDDTNFNLRILGNSAVQKSYSDFEITATELRDISKQGKVLSGSSPLYYDLLWNDSVVTKDAKTLTGWYFTTHLWHRKVLNGDYGNNNTNSVEGNVDISMYAPNMSELKWKRIVNTRFLYKFKPLNNSVHKPQDAWPYDTEVDFKIKNNKVINQDEQVIYKIGDRNYKGYIDTIAYRKDYLIYGVEDSTVIKDLKQVKPVTKDGKNITVSDQISIKYKSSTHLAFELFNKQDNNLWSYLPHSGGQERRIPLDVSSKYDFLPVFYIGTTQGTDYPFILIEVVQDTKGISYNKIKGIWTRYEEGSAVQQNLINNSIIIYGITNSVISNNGALYKVKQTTITTSSGTEEITELVGYPEDDWLVRSKDNELFGFHSGYIMAELYRDVPNQYGGPITNKDNDYVRQNTNWIPIGPLQDVSVEYQSDSVVGYVGDTYYWRWDCLKTMPITNEDLNQVIDITSFFVESRINLSGRTDRVGDTSWALDYVNFNAMNDVYSQKDNFFNYTNPYQDTEQQFPNLITYSGQKTNLSLIDSWQHINPFNVVDLDTDKGKLSALRRFNNEIYAFQDSGISKILYNSRAQINVTDGVPIELTNSGRVDGKYYITDKYGCQNKWSIAETPNGLYFIDDITKTISLFNGQNIVSLTDTKQMYSWINKCSRVGIWDIEMSSFEDSPIRTLYDKINGDVYFTTYREALAFNEKLGAFSSLYDYGGVTFMFTNKDNTYQVKDNNIYLLHGGDSYMQFFSKPNQSNYSISFIVNDNFAIDKIFENVEFRTNGQEQFNGLGPNSKTTRYPFNSLKVENEYQQSISTYLKLRKKFRTWRWQIGRDGRNRIRNPWIKVTMTGNNTQETRLYDIVSSYYV